MLIINSSKLLATHLKVPKDVKIPANTPNQMHWCADFFSLNGNFYYVFVNDLNPDETIALFSPTPLHYSQLAQNSADRIARFYAQSQNKLAFDNFQINAKEIIIVPDTNKQNFTILNNKIKAVKHQLKSQAKQVTSKPASTAHSVTENVDAHARKFYGGLLTHAVHKNTKGR